METPAGKILGRYEIVAELGRGAMGAVYKARDPKIDRFVAIKTILLHQSGVQEQREFRDRFFVEAQAAGRLLHPGIVAVFDVGEDPETSDPYIVMEYIEGQTLRDLLSGSGNKLPLDDALRITLEIAEALDYAHAQRVVHRDIKPANILITKEGQAKIGDFGIAQLDLAQLTVPGRVLGTPAYMSPEQLEGQQVDGRSDLFSLGGILYSVLTGFSPFQGNSATTVCYQVANRDPLQASALNPELPAELDAVIARALAKNPAERYQRGTEFARDLRQLREHAPTTGKGKLWFSQSEGRQRFLDGTMKVAVAAAKPVPAARPAPAAQPVPTARPASATKAAGRQAPPPLPGKARNVLSMFSSPQVQTGAAISIFMAALVLNYFSWRQLRTPGVAPTSVVENADQARGIDSRQEQRTLDLSVTGSGDQTDAKTENEAVATPIRKAAAPVRSKPAARAAPIVVSPAAPADVAHVAPKMVVPTVPKSVAKAGVTAVVTKTVPTADQEVAQVPRPNPVVSTDSNLEIRIENHFSDATLAIWIDDKLAYEHALRDGHKKRLILLGGGAKEKVTIPLSAGHHALRVQVRSASEQFDESKTLAGEFVKGGEKILSINFEKHTKEMRLALGTE
jgi:tRNA A-37 threonylcarbamoyl transferase component Bud32